ncbi:hypothetical protein Ocin01_16204 [Orchesella cincta]|uniref:Uncharacterized protein n=1 Tax=Orchesella cincta TaxID=48709 RepID=A0A1D2MBV1_ORCCI|nr:hypothetical protein Ocin01_16204 [Orchesella cincta]
MGHTSFAESWGQDARTVKCNLPLSWKEV